VKFAIDTKLVTIIWKKSKQMVIAILMDMSFREAVVFALYITIAVPQILVSCLARRLWESRDYSLKDDIILACFRWYIDSNPRILAST
jgi:predicted Kef-type K+ transport protein